MFTHSIGKGKTQSFDTESELQYYYWFFVYASRLAVLSFISLYMFSNCYICRYAPKHQDKLFVCENLVGNKVILIKKEQMPKMGCFPNAAIKKQQLF